MYIIHYLAVIIMHIYVIILGCILCLILLPNQTNINNGSRSNDAMVGLSDAIHGPLYAIPDTADIYCS